METITQAERIVRRKPSGKVAMHWIGCEWVGSVEHGESINPATGEVIGSYSMGGRKETELAVNAALRAFQETDWKHNRSRRARVLNAMAARSEVRAEELSQLLATEVGKILPHAQFETNTVPFNLRFNAALALTDSGRACEVNEDGLSIVIRFAASVSSRDVDRPPRVARALEAGTVWINDWASIHDEFEEGGFKQSGRGRLRGRSGLDDFLECQHIAFKSGKIEG